VPEERELRARLDLRDSGLRRLQSVTGVLIVAATALAGIFTGIAAGTTPGRKLIRVHPRTAAVRAVPHTAPARPTRVPPPPALPPLGSQAGPTPAPAPPAQPPAAPLPAAPPVVVSGGS